MKSWIFKLLEDLRTSLWFLPALMAIVSALLSIATSYADTYFLAQKSAYPALEAFIYSGESAGARTVLGAIAGSMITVAGTVFSITIVALSLASSQFGPRLLRNFLRDRSNQAVLGTFVATFLYCILVMGRVYGEASEVGSRVPAVSVTFAIGLGVASIGVLIYFIHHISQSMQAGHIVSSVYAELRAQVPVIFPQQAGSAAEEPSPSSEASSIESQIDAHGQSVNSTDSGYIQGLDLERLLALATEAELVVRVALRPGDFVLPGAAIVHFFPRLDDKRNDELAPKVRECFALDVYRTPHQNIEFGIDQIVEVAVRALSPGINDPFTAMACIDRLGATLALLRGKVFPSPYRSCAAGELRLIVPPISYRSLVDRSFNQIRQNARSVPSVIIRLTETLARIGETETKSRKLTLLRQLEAIDEAVASIEPRCDREDLKDRIARARKSLSRDSALATEDEPTLEEIARHHRRLEENT